jgi:hypothetical protein
MVAAAFQLFDVGRIHPVRERSLRELERTVDYIESNMPDAIGFETQREVLDYALSQTTVAGDYLEFGVFRGGTIRYIQKRLRRMGKAGAIIHGFDSFEGLPEAWGGSHLGQSAFSTRGKLPRVPRNVVLHRGWFSDTILEWRASAAAPLAFLHVDCDIYSSTVEVLEGLYDRMQVGTVIVFDEYFNYPNWRQHEFRAWREIVERHNLTYEYLAFARNQVAIRIRTIGTAASARKEMP